MRRDRPRRRAMTIVGGTVVLVMVGVALGYQGLRLYRPLLSHGQAYGIDVSRHQGTIDWRATAGDDIDYAYIKATEGQTWVDPQFEDNWRAADAAGVTRGAYHFFSLCSRGAGQLKNFLDTVPVDSGALAPAVDLEFGACTDRPAASTVERDLTVLLAGIEREWGRPAVIYALPEFVAAYPFIAQVNADRWERRILRDSPDPPWVIWQVSNIARVEGIRGGVDLNVWQSLDAGVAG